MVIAFNLFSSTPCKTPPRPSPFSHFIEKVLSETWTWPNLSALKLIQLTKYPKCQNFWSPPTPMEFFDKVNLSFSPTSHPQKVPLSQTLTTICKIIHTNFTNTIFYFYLLFNYLQCNNSIFQNFVLQSLTTL